VLCCWGWHTFSYTFHLSGVLGAEAAFVCCCCCCFFL
jgi:hypothetical protein